MPHKRPILSAQSGPLLPAMEGEFKLPGSLMRDRKPVYEKISRNAYLLKMRPKRRQRDEIGEPMTPASRNSARELQSSGWAGSGSRTDPWRHQIPHEGKRRHASIPTSRLTAVCKHRFDQCETVRLLFNPIFRPRRYLQLLTSDACGAAGGEPQAERSTAGSARGAG